MKKLFAILLALVMVVSISVSAMAADVANATIDTTQTGSINLWKYDLTNAEKDGVWDSSYVSTGVRDVAGVENILGSNAVRYGDTDSTSDLGNGQQSYGYAIKGVQFTYVKIADIYQYSEEESGSDHVEVLYGIKPNSNNRAMLEAMGVSYSDRYAAADQTVGGSQIYYFQSDVLINGLKTALDNNATTVKNALENYVATVGGTAMPDTDAYGHTSATSLPLGLYLIVETKVPEMVTDTTNPFLVSLPMTSVNGTNATDGGTRWIYDVALYPKNLTGIPSLEKTLRETKADTGKNGGSTTSITDGYAHTGTASGGDVIDYQIITTLPSITSAATYLGEYSLLDTLSKGLSYNRGDVKIEFFKNKNCAVADKIATWDLTSGKFTVTYGSGSGGASTMSIAMSATGLGEINSSTSVYTSATAVNSGYSDCTMRVTYQATLKGGNDGPDVVYGDAGNDNKVVLTWKRTNSSYYDTLVDDAHVYTYGMDLTKEFSDNRGDFSKVEFVMQNTTDNYYVKATLKSGIWYVEDHVADEADATHLIPTADGSLVVKGLEDDTYVITELRTDNAYTLLKENITLVIAQEDTVADCTIYGSDVLGLLQNDPRYASGFPGTIITDGGLANPLVNIPQTQLSHKLLTASATVDGNAVTMQADGGSDNALALLSVVNTRGFDLPQTGGLGNWMYPTFGLIGFAGCIFLIFVVLKKKDKKEQTSED